MRSEAAPNSIRIGRGLQARAIRSAPMLGSAPAAPRSLPATASFAALGGAMVIGLVAAWGSPLLDHALNPTSTRPGVISFLGVGLSVLALTVVLLQFGLRGVLPKGAVFAAAAIGYNALLIAVKFGMGPIAIYAQNDYYKANALPAGSTGVDPGFQVLTIPLAYPFLAAVMAILYGGAFFILYLIFNSRLRRRLGMRVPLERRIVQLFVVMFVLGVVGGITIIGLFGFLEYAFSIVYASVVGVLIALALVLAIALCSIAFREASEQAALTRNVTLLTTFAWVGLAFIAAYHILWVVFLLTLVSLWPLKPWAYVGGAK
jgi:hypothetical protein